MTDEDINWFEGKYPSWLEGIERNAKAAIDEIHRMAVEAMPKTTHAEMSAMERLLAASQSQYNTQLRNYNPYVNMAQHQNIGMQGLHNCNPYANMGMYGRSE
jgi:hypothetical protein